MSQVQHYAFKVCGEGDGHQVVPAALHISLVPQAVSGVVGKGRHLVVAIALGPMDQAYDESMESEYKCKEFMNCKLTDGDAEFDELFEDDDSTGEGESCPSPPDTSIPGCARLNEVVRGEDVMSQSSKESFAGSVHLAVRQLLGPMIDKIPPGHCVSNRIDDHVNVAATFSLLSAPAKVARFKYERDMKNWRSRVHTRQLHRTFQQSVAPENVLDEGLWHSKILPFLETGAPGRPPKHPKEAIDDDKLWEKAFLQIHVQSVTDSDAGSSDAEGALGEEVGGAH